MEIEWTKEVFIKASNLQVLLSAWDDPGKQAAQESEPSESGAIKCHHDIPGSFLSGAHFALCEVNCGFPSSLCGPNNHNQVLSALLNKEFSEQGKRSQLLRTVGKNSLR